MTNTPAPRPTCAIPNTPLANAAAGLDACVHCGFCLQACPTYVNLEDENDSPRGRLVLMRRMLEGEIALDDADAGTHMDRCLGCRACETACPSGVPYGELLEATRASTVPVRGMPFVARAVLWIFGHTMVMRIAIRLGRVARATGIPRILAGLLPKRLAFPMAMLASTKPTDIRELVREDANTAAAETAIAIAPATAIGSTNQHTKAPSNSALPAQSPNAQTVTTLKGCVMDGLFSHVNHATVRVLQFNGFTVHETPRQHCCGALHAHAGDNARARELAKRNIVAFERTAPSPIVINSAGCGAMIKQYGHLLHDEPSWADRANAVAARARDVSEILASVGPRRGAPLAVCVTHDPPCHQMHAQRLVNEPLAVLHAIPLLELAPLEDAEQCCGSAGIYNLVEPETSDAVLAPKLAQIDRSRSKYGAQLVATGNPGCMMQLGAGLLLSDSPLRVVHPVELLDASYRALGSSNS